MSSAAPAIFDKNSIEILPSTEEKDKRKIQFAKKVVLYAFINEENKKISDLAGYIADRFNEVYIRKEWNCCVCELNKGAVSYISTSNITIKFNNYKIIIWAI